MQRYYYSSYLQSSSLGPSLALAGGRSTGIANLASSVVVFDHPSGVANGHNADRPTPLFGPANSFVPVQNDQGISGEHPQSAISVFDLRTGKSIGSFVGKSEIAVLIAAPPLGNGANVDQLQLLPDAGIYDEPQQ